ncbi:MAG: histidine kinase [Methylococcaceae bacterium]
MNLQFHLLIRIALVALMCLSATITFVLYRSDSQARLLVETAADSLSKQLEFQLLRINSGFGQASPFPDFDLWKQTSSIAGICLHFARPEGSGYNLCNGTKIPSKNWPDLFESVYRTLFKPGMAITRSIMFNNQEYGKLTITPSEEMEIDKAWQNINSLFGLSLITIFAVCVLVYLTVNHTLQPTRKIVEGIGRLELGDLDYRLPPFKLTLWQQIGQAINQLAASQQQLLAERQKLLLKLLNIQDEERRYLARELHDELGQCLAGINAVAASISYVATQQCPSLVDEAGHISRISEHMMATVRGLLSQLRPAEFDELGLAASLNSLVNGWNSSSAGMVRFKLNLIGNCDVLPEALALTLFRVAQESLTNIAKHSTADRASVTLVVHQDSVDLAVKDNGKITTLPSNQGLGIGLLGIQERVSALDGRFSLAIAPPQGLSVEVWLPIAHSMAS